MFAPRQAHRAVGTRARAGAAAPAAPPGPPRLVFDERLQIAPPQRMAEFTERLGLDLPNPLAGNGEPLSDLFERVLALFADAEAQTKDLLLLRRQRGQRALDLRGEVLPQQGVVRRAGRLVLEEVAELAVLTDRRLQRQRLARGLQDQPHLLRGHTCTLRQLFRRGLAAHLVDHVPVHARDAVERLDHVHRNPDRPRRGRDGASDGLTDPPRRVRRELEPPPILEAVHGLHQADVALLDEVEQRQIAAEIALGHRHGEPEVGLHQLALGLPDGPVARLDFDQQRLQLLARQSRLLLELLQLSGQRCGPGAPRLLREAVDTLAEAPPLADEVIDQRRLERHVGDGLLDPRAVRRDLLLHVRPAGRRAPLVGQRLFEARDLALKPANATEGQEHGADFLRLELATLRKNDDVVGGDVVVTEAVTDLEQRAHRHRDARQPATQRDLADFDPSADLNFLLRG